MTLWLIYTSYINIYFWKPLQFSSPLSVYGPRDSLLTVLHALHPQIRKKAVSFISLAFICIQSSTPLQDGVYEITQAKHSRNSLCINPNADRSNLTTFSCHCVALTAYSGYRLFFLNTLWCSFIWRNILQMGQISGTIFTARFHSLILFILWEMKLLHQLLCPLAPGTNSCLDSCLLFESH